MTSSAWAGQNAREYETAARSHSAEQSRSEYLERVRQDIGHNQGVTIGGQIPRQHKLGRHFVVFGVKGRAFNGLRIDVGTSDVRSAEFCSGNRQNARTATIVKNGIRVRDMRIKPLQAQMRCRMRARTESNARIQADVDGFARGRFVPARNDPESVAHLYR